MKNRLNFTRFFLIAGSAAILAVLFQNCSEGFQVSSTLNSAQESSTTPDPTLPPGATPVAPTELNLNGQSGVAAAWRFNQIVGPRTPDDSTNRIDGTISGASTLTPGKFANAFSFNSTNYVNVGQPAELNFDHNQPTTAYTISAWIRTTSFGSLVAKRGAVFGNIQYQIFVFTDGRLGAHVGGETQLISGGPVLNDGAWHHVAMTVSTSGGMSFAELYVDEVSVTRQAIQGTVTNTEDIWIGSRPGGFAYTGLIDEVIIFNRALSLAELSALY